MKHTISLLWLIYGITACTSTQQSADEAVNDYYAEQYRPQFHFSPEANWMNDPNGMVFYEGEYHLFYQYYPDSTVWGPMHWGHAVSQDMVNWEHLPIGLYPDDLGYIFSGSAVVDWNNTSGFGDGSKPPLVAIFTHHLMEGEKAGRTDYQYQSIAYSLDNGRSWTKYEGNPVLPNQGIKDFRDPKVFWHEPSDQWIMILAVWDHVELYGSSDLKSWNKLSDFGYEDGNHGGVWECPDLFELPVEGTEESKWVMIVSIGRGGPNKGSATQYFVGDFDGKTFVNENDAQQELWVDHGPDNYAGVTWSDVPESDGRRLFIGWMSNWIYALVVPTEKWRSAMTVARELKLKQTSNGARLYNPPVAENLKLRKSSMDIDPFALGDPISLDANPTLSELELTFTNYEKSKEFGLELSNGDGDVVTLGFDNEGKSFFIDRSNSGITAFQEDFASRVTAPRIIDDSEINLRIFIDTSSIEMFGDDGANALSALVFPRSEFDRIRLYSRGGSARLKDGSIHTLGRIW